MTQSATRPARAKQNSDEVQREWCKKRSGWIVNSVFIGEEVANGVYAERTEEQRWVIRIIKGGWLKKIGEVTGRTGCFRALTVAGAHISLAQTLSACCMALSEAHCIRK